MNDQKEFILTALGNASGEIKVTEEEEKAYFLRAEKYAVRILKGEFDSITKLTFLSHRGKMADSEDSLLFFGFKIDPSSENFRISGDFYVEHTRENPGRLSGFGAFAIDTLASEKKGCRHRNMLSAGVHRSVRMNEYTRGIRIVSGYTDAEAFSGNQQRKLDATNACREMGESPKLQTGESIHVTLEKTDQGFTAKITSEGRTETLTFAGCDFLMQQEESAIYAGFGAAGFMSVTVSDIHWETMPGKVSHTPTENLKNVVPDYPFDRSLIQMDELRWQPVKKTIVASPDGRPQNEGTQDSPVDLQTALLSVENGGKIILENGVYRPKTSYIAPKRKLVGGERDVLICAQNTKGVIIDGSDLEDPLPIMILAGDHWHVRGLAFRKGKGPGMFVCGNNNTVELCEAYDNEDTGFLICTFPGTGKDRWPSNNLMLSCDSHHNCDQEESNADGFGAKLSIGEGNRFVKCTAYHNIDDGFDLYSKSTLGPIGSVTMDNCIAFANGYLHGEKDQTDHKRGTGFKLGGENQPVRHVVTNCIASDNALAGFSTNSNPYVKMENLLSCDNGSKPKKYDYQFATEKESDWEYKDLWTEKSWQRGPLPVLMFLVPRTSGGGAEKVITSLASQMIEKYRVYLVTTIKEDGVQGYEFSDEIEYINIYKRFEEPQYTQTKAPEPKGFVAKVKARLGLTEKAVVTIPDPIDWEKERFRFQIDCIKRLKKELYVDCAISFLNSANYINAMSKGDERCIISIRSFLSGPFAPSDCRSEAGHDRIRDACQTADIVVPVSLEAGANLAEEYEAPAKRLKTIYNYIDLDSVREKCKEEIADDDLRRKLSDSAFTFISVGRLTEKKGQWHMVRAFRKVVDKYPGALLLILGRDGKGTENVSDYLKSIVHDNGLEENVLLPGFLENPFPVLARSDSYVMTSFNEGFPNALVEAMAVGLPAIAGDCSSGPREILAPDTDYNNKTQSLQMAEYGIIVPECSGNKWNTEPLEEKEQILADAMILMIENDQMREEYRQKGLKRIADFAKSEILSQWEDIIENDN